MISPRAMSASSLSFRSCKALRSLRRARIPSRSHEAARVPSFANDRFKAVELHGRDHAGARLPDQARQKDLLTSLAMSLHERPNSRNVMICHHLVRVHGHFYLQIRSTRLAP